MADRVTWLARDEFAELASKDQVPEGAALRKAAACDITVKAPELGEREVEIVLSTEETDRDRDEINADGWKLTNYEKNPVVLFGHDYRMPPIGRARKTWIAGRKLRAIDHFVEPEIYPLGETVLQMLRRGYLNAASVGFAPIKWARNEDRGGIDFIEQELLEHSIVPVPANAGALVMRAAAGDLDLEPLKSWAKQLLADEQTADSQAFDQLFPGWRDWKPEPEFDVMAAVTAAREVLAEELPRIIDAEIRRRQGKLD